MKKFIIALALVLSLFSMPVFAANIGYTTSASDFDKNTSNVISDVNSFLSGGVLGSGYVNGGQFAGGQATTTHIGTFWTPNDVGQGTQNYGEAIGGWNYSIGTGNKNFLFFIPPMAGAIGNAEGSTFQWSKSGTSIFNLTSTGIGIAGSNASQNSGAGFIGGDASVLIGKNKNTSDSFSADSIVQGFSYSESYKGSIGDTKYIGTKSGAGNTANTYIQGDDGKGYAFGSGQTSGGSSIIAFNGNGSTYGSYSGQFSYCGNGGGSAIGYSESFRTTLPYGVVFGTNTGISINMPH